MQLDTKFARKRKAVRVMMHMVKAILPKLQLEAEPMTRLSRQLTGVVGKVRRVPNPSPQSSHPEQPTDEWW